MDLGVGSTILAGSLTRQRSLATAPLAGQARALRTLVRHLPLLLLGLGRLLAVRATNYHEVHSEYGTHWNFFFTLGLVSLLMAWFAPRSALGCACAASTLLAVHQWLLLSGLTELVHEAPRATLVLANKEGLVSLLGYLALALAASACAPLVPEAPPMAKGAGFTTHELTRRVAPLLLVDIGLWLASGMSDAWVEPTSRRLCNAAYVLWVLAQGLLALALAALRELLVDQAGDGE